MTYRITLDPNGKTYRVAMKSAVAFSGAQARISPSALVTVIAPDTDGAGPDSFRVVNISPLTALQWGSSQLNAPAENINADYLFFSPVNADVYLPFDIPANTWIDLFTFENGNGCQGDLVLYENGADPLASNVNLNPDQNMVVLGAGPGNLWVANEGLAHCTDTGVTYRISLDPDGKTYRVAMRSALAYSGSQARISPSALITVIAPDLDGTGPDSFLVANLTALTDLQWESSQLNAPSENTGADYLFFGPSNADFYVPFDVPAGVWIDLFTFESGNGCLGDLVLYENGQDPLATNVNFNPDQNMVILGGGPSNLWVANISIAACTPTGDLDMDGIVDDDEPCTNDRDGDGVPDCDDFDPQGWIYYEHTGQIITGATISVVDISTGSSANVNLLSDGSTGLYQWTVSAPGIYRMTVTPPTGWVLSGNCLPQDPPPFDPTGFPNPLSLGAGQNGNTGFMTSNVCSTYYLTFDLDVNDPIIINNNIPLRPETEIGCSDNIDNDEDSMIDCSDADCQLADITITGDCGGLAVLNPQQDWTFQWYLDGVFIPGAVSSFFVPGNGPFGEYSAEITNIHGCKKTSDPIAACCQPTMPGISGK